jgi:hypothetical protein
LSRDGLISYPKPAYLEGRRVPAVDASDVVEKGRNGETYRLHYAIDLHTMTSDTFKITKEETGETLSNFNFRCGDLVVADRAYGTLKGINHCLNCGADYILRLRTGCFAVYDENGNKFDITGVFAGLKSGESGEAAVFAVLPDKTRIPVRICAKRKDKEGCKKSLKKLERRASCKGGNLQVRVFRNPAGRPESACVTASCTADAVLFFMRMAMKNRFFRSTRTVTHALLWRETTVSTSQCPACALSLT